ncbi:MAG: hypothetical protein AAFY71_22220 [Bacteroidota bacterium]
MKKTFTFQYSQQVRLSALFVLWVLLSFSAKAQCDDDGNTWNLSWKSCVQSANPNANRPSSHWVMYEFEQAENIDSTHVWNANKAGESILGLKDVIIDYSSDGTTWNELGIFTFPQANEAANYEGFNGPNFGGIWVKKVLITVLSTYGNGSCASLAEMQFNINEDACYGELDICGNCDGSGESTWYRDEDGDGLGSPSIVTVACTQPLGYVANSDDNCDNGSIGWTEIENIFMENGCRGCHGQNGAGGLDLTSYVTTLQGGDKCGTNILTGTTLADIIMIDSYAGCGTPIGFPSMNQRTGGLVDSAELAAIQLWIDKGAPEDCNCDANSQDSDNDGICDIIDSCPSLNNSLIGTPCDDGLSCTDNDVWTWNCECAGTPKLDTDNDGICDSEDLAPTNPCTADGIIDGSEPNGWVAQITNDCDQDGIKVVQGDLNDNDACINAEGSLSTAACNCGAAAVTQGGVISYSTGVNNVQNATGPLDGVFTNNISGGGDSIIFVTPFLGKGEEICIMVRFTDANTRMRVEVNGDLFTFLNQTGNDQLVCLNTRRAGIQHILVKEDHTPGAISIDGITYDHCPCTPPNGDPDSTAIPQAYSTLTGWQTATEEGFWVCEGDSLSLNIDSDIASTFEWDGPNMSSIQTGTLNLGKVGPSHQGLYTATYQNASGCTVRKDIKVYVEAAPQISYTKIDPGCNDPNSGSITFNFTNSTNRSYIEFSINGPNGPYRKVKDNIGSFSMSDLSEGTYDLWARWAGNHIQVPLGEAKLIGCNQVELGVWLEGPYLTDSMGTSLRPNISLLDPYLGQDSAINIPADVVDWILVQIRDKADSSIVLSQRAAFLRSDGKIISMGGNTKFAFNETIPDEAFIAIVHRNHLAVMTATAVNTTQMLDFGDPNTAVFGFNPRKIVNGRALLWSGDSNGDGTINAVDKNNFWRLQNGNAFDYGQAGGDMNMDGVINAVDANNYWRLNNGRTSQIPN